MKPFRTIARPGLPGAGSIIKLKSLLPPCALAALAAALGLALPAPGAIRLASVFTDHMVLQRCRCVPVWGRAEPGDKVTVRFAGQAATAVTDKDGRWNVELGFMAPNATPATLTAALSDGTQTAAIADVLVGDVWLCSGQSNMQMGLPECFNGPQEAAAANCPSLRMLRVPKGGSDNPREDAPMAWKICSPAVMTESGGFSAAGYYFGRELQQILKVPVGLIDSTVGGTPIESWTPPLPPNQPGGDLFNAMIQPLVPFTLRGCIWYQGEYNLALFGDTLNYTAKMKALIDGWRRLWPLTDMPFYYVQLAPLDWKTANYPNYQSLPVFWEAQTLVQTAVPNTGMAITTDITDDLKNIHPKDKKSVGLRLAALALHNTYARSNLVCHGPEFKSMHVDGSNLKVTFDGCDGGLKTRDGKVYTKVSVNKVTAQAMHVQHADGISAIPYEMLPAEMQDLYQFDPQEKDRLLAAERKATQEHVGLVADSDKQVKQQAEQQRLAKAGADKLQRVQDIALLKKRMATLTRDISAQQQAIRLEKQKPLSHAPAMEARLREMNAELTGLTAKLAQLEVQNQGP